MKLGMTVYVYRSDFDATNGGVSSYNNSFVLIGEGVPELVEPRHDAPALYVRRKPVYSHCNAKDGEGYLCACPDAPISGMRDDMAMSAAGWMFGGNFLWSSDSRLPSIGPMPIHDRQE